MSSSRVNLENFLVPLEEITLATRNFHRSFEIERSESRRIYKGQLSENSQNRMATFTRLDPSVNGVEERFRREIEMSLVLNHENIIPFIGYCDERNEMIIVYGYTTNGSLAHLLLEPNKRRHLTWEGRLKICVGVARGLKYLHSGLGEHGRVIHCNINSDAIFLDDNLEPKIGGFGQSILVSENESHRQVYGPPDLSSHIFSVGTKFHVDPIYRECGIPKEESDVYSFGVILFEILSGMLVYQTRRIGDDKPRNLINFVRRYYDDGLDNLIDLHIRDENDGRSFNTFKEIAYKCISLNKKDRPTTDELIMTFEKALDIQGSTSTATIWSFYNKLEHFLIPLEEIKLATGNFSPESQIGVGGFGNVYRGQLSERWQNRTAAIKRHNPNPNRYYQKSQFLNELEMISSFHDENIIPFIGYCNEGNEMIIVSEYAVHGSLDNHLYDSDTVCRFTWVQRLKICLGAARGLDYLLHSGLGEQGKVVHRNVKSAKILLDDNLEAKICGFGLAKVAPRNHRHKLEDTNLSGSRYYFDPLYDETGILKAESDIYSFGVVMFELLSGMLAYSERSIGNDRPQTLINLVRNYQDDGQDKLIDPYIKDDIDTGSFLAYKEIAYDCISFDLKDRPAINRIVKRIEGVLEIHNCRAASAVIVRSPQHQNLQYFQIPLTEINSAIGIRSPQTRIGAGGFGVVYRGQLSERWQNRVVAIKCLLPNSNREEDEFRKELDMMSSFHHENIIPFIGYSDEGKEKIMVYEYAVNGSLDCHLEDPNRRRYLTWAQRLKICLGAARGLSYLHSGRGEDNRVIHRDVKSGNILLDENLEAKICDFGLSKSGPINQPNTQVYTNAAGTNFYIDPIYNESGILRKESDVYSLGVVLFEMLSGMVAYDPKSFRDSMPQYLINLVRRYYDDGLEWLVDPFISDEIDKCSYHTFEQIAYQCISLRTQDRPKMDTVIDRIEEALDFQVMKTISTKEVTKS